jgi:predicted neuraminidase
MRCVATLPMVLLGLVAAQSVPAARNNTAVKHAWVASLGSGPLKEIKYSHMPTIAVLPGGTLAVAFQATTTIEGADDQHIRFTTSTDEGISWAPALRAVGNSSSGPALWGPVLFAPAPGSKLFLFFSLSPPGSHHSVGGALQVVTATSKSWGAETSPPWSAARTILEQGSDRMVTANRVAVVGQRWLLPIWYEGDPPTGAAAVLESSDEGKSWAPHGHVHGSSHGTVNDTKIIENSLAPLPSSKGVLQIYRAGKGVLYSSISDDPTGVNWSKSARPTTIINPSAKASIFARSDNGAIVLSCNPSKTLRSPLALLQSTTGAVSDFTHLATLEDDDKRSFAYPTSVMAGAKIYTVYSVYDPHATAPHTHHWWGIRIATVSVTLHSDASSVPTKIDDDDANIQPRPAWAAGLRSRWEDGHHPLPILSNVTAIKVYNATRKAGVYSHAPMISYHNKVLLVSWKNHPVSSNSPCSSPTRLLSSVLCASRRLSPPLCWIKRRRPKTRLASSSAGHGAVTVEARTLSQLHCFRMFPMEPKALCRLQIARILLPRRKHLVAPTYLLSQLWCWELQDTCTWWRACSNSAYTRTRGQGAGMYCCDESPSLRDGLSLGPSFGLTESHQCSSR